jgi:hypothetical protein
MFLQTLRAFSLAPGRPGSIWKYLVALVRSTGVSGRFAGGFRIDLHFADVWDIVHAVFLQLLACKESPSDAVEAQSISQVL